MGTWPTVRGNVTVSFPEGTVRPNNRSAIAGPPMVPGCHAHNTARARAAVS